MVTLTNSHHETTTHLCIEPLREVLEIIRRSRDPIGSSVENIRHQLAEHRRMPIAQSFVNEVIHELASVEAIRMRRSGRYRLDLDCDIQTN